MKNYVDWFNKKLGAQYLVKLEIDNLIYNAVCEVIDIDEVKDIATLSWTDKHTLKPFDNNLFFLPISTICKFQFPKNWHSFEGFCSICKKGTGYGAGLHIHCPNCGSSPREHKLVNFDPMFRDGDIHCSLCNTFVRGYDAS